jgi:hypothetical protein
MREQVFSKILYDVCVVTTEKVPMNKSYKIRTLVLMHNCYTRGKRQHIRLSFLRCISYSSNSYFSVVIRGKMPRRERRRIFFSLVGCGNPIAVTAHVLVQ